MPNLGWPEILLILVVVIILFGSKKLPDAARSLGRSMRIFKSEVKEMRKDDDGAEQPQPLEQSPQANTQSYWDQQAGQQGTDPVDQPRQQQPRQ